MKTLDVRIVRAYLAVLGPAVPARHAARSMRNCGHLDTILFHKVGVSESGEGVSADRKKETSMSYDPARRADIPLIKAISRKAHPSPFIADKTLDACRNHAARLEATSKAYGFSCYHEAKVSLNTRRLGGFDQLGPDGVLNLIKPHLRECRAALCHDIENTVKSTFRSAHYGPVNRTSLITGILSTLKDESPHEIYIGVTNTLMKKDYSPAFNVIANLILPEGRAEDLWFHRACSMVAMVDEVAQEIVLRDEQGTSDVMTLISAYTQTPLSVFALIRRAYAEHMVLPNLLGFHTSLPGFNLDRCIDGLSQSVKSIEQAGWLTMQMTRAFPENKRFYGR